MPRYDDLAFCGKQPVLCSNLGLGEQGSILTKLDSALYIAPDLTTARQIKAQLDALNKQNVIIDDFDRPYTLSTFSNSDKKYDIISALYHLINGHSIIISTSKILSTLLPNLDDFKANILTLEKNKEYNRLDIGRKLISIGYKKVETAISRGEFSVRGDIIDIFNTVDDTPTRLDFFDISLEEIYTYDSIDFEKKECLNTISITPNKLMLTNESEQIINSLKNLAVDNPIFYDIISSLENKQDIPLEFIAPFTNSLSTFLDTDIPIVINNFLQVENQINLNYEDLNKKLNNIFKSEEIINLYKNNKKLLKNNEIYLKYSYKIVFFENFDLNSTDIKNRLNSSNFIHIDFKTKNFPSFLKNISSIKNELNPYLEKQIYLCLDSLDTYKSIEKIFKETAIPYTTNKNAKGIILTELKIPYNICFGDEEKFYIGSTNFAHKKQFKSETKSSIKYLPKAGEYVVHSTHGIGRCEGVVNVNVSGIDKEFFKIIYRGGDSLYVPYENADTLSLYMADGENISLNKLGGKEFLNEKLKAVKSIEDMSHDLLELYAKRKATKGFKYPEDDYIYTEFENAFEYTETIDQLQAISDIKQDMTTGKVMDRLICGDVGFGKTEVALRAVFKAIQANKQVAILAPTTILSLQHFMTANTRMKEFGVKVEMLNRFRAKKEQSAILEDLRLGKINVICGTHRLLSNDVKFHDLGLLVLDEEQRFGVKAKEQIKQIKNNIDVLTLSATPIPRTLSMSLMSIRDISIINTPPVDRLPVKTYVLGYNEDIILSAINDEINRDGQVLIVYNNIEYIYKLALNLEKKLDNPRAHFDVAHGQMSEIALENAIKRLYDKETNIFVSTTLIENGIDLPKANTLIVIDSDRLGLSQMYQLRGRVGRNTEQAYAYFTYNKGKVLTEDATNRLQAIAENTELGSGFKIAMRDLSIRGAGELLGKVQHGHMVKIGYDMYTKLLNDTLKRLKGEKVDIEREIKIDIAIASKIPYTFVDDETERLKIIAKISNISDKASARTTLNELIISYGKLPNEIYTLTNITLLKSLAIKCGVKLITINKSRIAVTFYNDTDIKKLIDKVKKYPHFTFENATLPTITLKSSEFSIQTAITYIIGFFEIFND